MTGESKARVTGWIDENAQRIFDISDEIWDHPELAMGEERAADLLCDLLDGEGFDVDRGVAGMPTAFVAEHSVGSGSPVVGILAEYDALPALSNEVVSRKQPIVEGGPGHGCGHNLIGTGNTAAAIALSHAMASDGIDGTVRVYGTPGEELLISKVFMARDGLFDDCDVILTSHPTWENAANANSCYALLSAEFTFHGESCHMPSTPQTGRNALDAAIMTINGANTRKKHMHKDTVVEYVVPDGGLQPNIVPDVSRVWFFVRHPTVSQVLTDFEKVRDAAGGAATSTGTELEERFITGCYGYLPNDRIAEVIYENALEVGPPTFTEEEETFAGEIMAEYDVPGRSEPLHTDVDLLADGVDKYSQDDGDASWIAPLGRFNYAFPRRVPYHGWGFTAVSGSSIGRKGMLFNAKTLATSAIDVLTRPGLLEEIQAEHGDRTEGFSYDCLVPDDVDPITAEFVQERLRPPG